MKTFKGILIGVLIMACFNVIAFESDLVTPEVTPDISFKKTEFIALQYTPFEQGGLLANTRVISRLKHYSANNEQGELESFDLLSESASDFFQGNLSTGTAFLEILHQRYIANGFITAEDSWN